MHTLSIKMRIQAPIFFFYSLKITYIFTKYQLLEHGFNFLLQKRKSYPTSKGGKWEVKKSQNPFFTQMCRRFVTIFNVHTFQFSPRKRNLMTSIYSSCMQPRNVVAVRAMSHLNLFQSIFVKSKHPMVGGWFKYQFCCMLNISRCKKKISTVTI